MFTLSPKEASDIIIFKCDIKEAAVVRTIISLPEKDKRWLDKQSKALNVPMASLVRQAIELLRFRDSLEQQKHFGDVLKRSAGIWKKGDGLAWQRKMRAEWR